MIDLLLFNFHIKSLSLLFALKSINEDLNRKHCIERDPMVIHHHIHQAPGRARENERLVYTKGFQIDVRRSIWLPTAQIWSNKNSQNSRDTNRTDQYVFSNISSIDRSIIPNRKNRWRWRRNQSIEKSLLEIRSFLFDFSFFRSERDLLVFEVGPIAVMIII